MKATFFAPTIAWFSIQYFPSASVKRAQRQLSARFL